MPPLLIDEPHNDHELNFDRFSSCGNDCDSAPTCSHQRRKFGVHFRPIPVEIYQVPNREDYTPKEVNAFWYSSEERSRMRKECEDILLRMGTGKRPMKNTSYRGLETYYKSNKREYEKTRHACIDAVMHEQYRQWSESELIDWELLREASLAVSTCSASMAYMMAAHDENDACKVYTAMAR